MLLPLIPITHGSLKDCCPFIVIVVVVLNNTSMTIVIIMFPIKLYLSAVIQGNL